MVGAVFFLTCFLWSATDCLTYWVCRYASVIFAKHQQTVQKCECGESQGRLRLQVRQLDVLGYMETTSTYQCHTELRAT